MCPTIPTCCFFICYLVKSLYLVRGSGLWQLTSLTPSKSPHFDQKLKSRKKNAGIEGGIWSRLAETKQNKSLIAHLEDFQSDDRSLLFLEQFSVEFYYVGHSQGTRTMY